ncbi:hypothetical protein M9H77_17747 [Catharanthus roseus]|uniref:Uncharacterized protein n=1 Tax=Catharanthus roseus TaxID=4058 RepID=A0ACC0B5H4_CATRO|nr:hypothetical protein M9H77_17747 [Catharanthus roseus]
MMETMVGMLTEEATIDGHFTHRSQIGIGNISSRAKTFDHIPDDDYCENSPYNVHKRHHASHDYSYHNCDITHLLVIQDLFHAIFVFIAHDVEPWNISNSLENANGHTFGFLENNSYGFDGSLFSLLGDHCAKFQGEVVEHFQYALTSLDPYVMGFVEHNHVEKPLLLVNGLIVKFVKGLNLSL